MDKNPVSCFLTHVHCAIALFFGGSLNICMRMQFLSVRSHPYRLYKRRNYDCSSIVLQSSIRVINVWNSLPVDRIDSFFLCHLQTDN